MPDAVVPKGKFDAMIADDDLEQPEPSPNKTPYAPKKRKHTARKAIRDDDRQRREGSSPPRRKTHRATKRTRRKEQSLTACARRRDAKSIRAGVDVGLNLTFRPKTGYENTINLFRHCVFTTQPVEQTEMVDHRLLKVRVSKNASIHFNRLSPFRF